MVRLADLIAFLSADTKGLKSDLSEGENEVQKSGGKIGGIMTGIAQGIGQGIFGMVQNAIGGVRSYVSESINAASDLNESINKTNVVFGENADAVLAWADNSATALGQSKNEALSALGTFGNLFKSMQLGAGPTMDMSKGLVQLASDLASFNNMDPSEVLDKLKAGITGESEPLKSLGVNINAATVEAKALSMGLVQTSIDMTKVRGATLDVQEAQRKAITVLGQHGEASIEYRQAVQSVDEAQQRLEKAMAGTTVELTAAQKAQATYALIMEQTTTAQGDFANTSDGLANSQRIAAAQWENMKTVVGSALLPVYAQLMVILNQLLESVLPPLADFIQGQVVPAMQSLADIIGSLTPEMQENILKYGAMGLAAAALLLGVNSLITGIGSMIGLVTTLTGWYGSLAAAIGPAIAGLDLWSMAAGAATTVTGALSAAMALLLSPIGLIVLAIAALAAAWYYDWGGIREKTQVVIEWLSKQWANIVLWFTEKLPASLEAMKNAWSARWQEIQSAVKEKVQPILDAFSSMRSWLENTLTNAFNSLKSLIGRLEFRNPFANLIRWIEDLIDKIRWVLRNLPLVGNRSVTSSAAEVSMASIGALTMANASGLQLASAPVMGGGITVNVYATKVASEIDEYRLAYRIADVIRRSR